MFFRLRVVERVIIGPGSIEKWIFGQSFGKMVCKRFFVKILLDGSGSRC